MTENTTQHAHEISKDGKGSYAEVHGLAMYKESLKQLKQRNACRNAYETFIW
jgi:hypothetical protein